MPQIDLMSWISFFIGIVGLITGGYQIWSSKKLRIAYKEKCKNRYKTVSELVIQLTENIGEACVLVGQVCVSKNNRCAILAAKVDSSMTIAKSLIGFCNRLNEDFKNEFGSEVDNLISDKLKDLPCIDVIKSGRSRYKGIDF